MKRAPQPSCKCGRKRLKDKPACQTCWNDYLYDSGPAVYVPKRDGVKNADSLSWEREMVRAWRAGGRRGSPFRDG